MRKTIGKLLLTGGMAATAAVLGAASSLAASASWSVTPGGTVSMKNSGKFTLKDTATSNSLACAHSSGTAVFKAGSGQSGKNIVSVKALKLGACTGSGGLSVTITAGLPWKLSASTYNPNVTSGLTTGTVSGIHASISGSGCTATLDGTGATASDGSTEFHYHNSLHKVKIESAASTLHLYNVTGCGGQFSSGDAITISGSYIVTPAQTITES